MRLCLGIIFGALLLLGSGSYFFYLRKADSNSIYFKSFSLERFSFRSIWSLNAKSETSQEVGMVEVRYGPMGSSNAVRKPIEMYGEVFPPWNFNPPIKEKNKFGVLFLYCIHSPVYSGYTKGYNNTRGKPHGRLLWRAVSSLKKFNPGLPVAVVVDDSAALSKDLRALFNEVIFLNTSSMTKPWQEKLPAIFKSPFHKTLVLDADTETCGDIWQLSTILDRTTFALSVQHPWVKHFQETGTATADTLHGLKMSTQGTHHYFCFVGFRKSPQAWDIFKAVMERNHKGMPDQNAMYRVMEEYRQDLSVTTLSRDVFFMNRSIEMPVTLYGRVRVLHGVETDCNKINSYIGPRVYKETAGIIAHLDMKDWRWKERNALPTGSPPSN